MNEKTDFVLVKRPSSALEKVAPGAKRVLSCMVADALALAKKKTSELTVAKFRIGDYEWCEPDYSQILIWAKALKLKPEEIIEHLQSGRSGRKLQEGCWEETHFSGGRLIKINWDFALLPLINFEFVSGLKISHLAFHPHIEIEDELGECTLNVTLPNLTHLSCFGLLLERLDLSAVPNLLFLECSRNRLSRLDLSPVPALEYLWCAGKQIRYLDLSCVPRLKELHCYVTSVEDLDLSRVPELQVLDYSGCGLTQLALPNLPELYSLKCYRNQLTKLNLSEVPNLIDLECSSNQLAELDLSVVPHLETLVCYDNDMEALDIRPLQHLKKLMFHRNKTRLIQRPDQHFE